MSKVTAVANIGEDEIFTKCKAIFDRKSGFELTRKVYDQNKNWVNQVVEEAEFMDNSPGVPNHFRFELDGDLYYFSRANNLPQRLVIGQ